VRRRPLQPLGRTGRPTPSRVRPICSAPPIRRMPARQRFDELYYAAVGRGGEILPGGERPRCQFLCPVADRARYCCKHGPVQIRNRLFEQRQIRHVERFGYPSRVRAASTASGRYPSTSRSSIAINTGIADSSLERFDLGNGQAFGTYYFLSSTAEAWPPVAHRRGNRRTCCRAPVSSTSGAAVCRSRTIGRAMGTASSGASAPKAFRWSVTDFPFLDHLSDDPHTYATLSSPAPRANPDDFPWIALRMTRSAKVKRSRTDWTEGSCVATYRYRDRTFARLTDSGGSRRVPGRDAAD